MCGIAGFCNGGEHWKQDIERMNEKILNIVGIEKEIVKPQPVQELAE